MLYPRLIASGNQFRGTEEAHAWRIKQASEESGRADGCDIECHPATEVTRRRKGSAMVVVLMVGYTSVEISSQEQIRSLSWNKNGGMRGFD